MLSFSNIIVESDSEIAYQSAFGDGDGLLLICGTGSILFGKRNGVEVRIGGWGNFSEMKAAVTRFLSEC